MVALIPMLQARRISQCHQQYYIHCFVIWRSKRVKSRPCIFYKREISQVTWNQSA